MSIMKVKSEFFEVSVEGDTPQELWEQAAFWHSLPTACPVDGSPVRFGYAKRDGYDFYYLESTGEQRYEFQFGQSLEDKSLFPGKVRKGADGKKSTVQQWAYYDADKQAQVVVWENGRTIGGNAKQSPSTLAGNGKQDYEKRVEVAGRDALDEAIDAAFGGEDAPLSQDGPRLGNATKGQLGTMHALGIALYGDARTWDIKRPVVTKHISQGRVESSAMLTHGEIERLIYNLEAKIREHYDLLADKCNQCGIQIDDVDPYQLVGVPLAHSYVAATKAFSKNGERVAA